MSGDICVVMDRLVEDAYTTYFLLGRNRIDYLPTQKGKKKIYAIECRMDITEDIKLTITYFTSADVKEVDCIVNFMPSSPDDINEALTYMAHILTYNAEKISGSVGVKLLYSEDFVRRISSHSFLPITIHQWMPLFYTKYARMVTDKEVEECWVNCVCYLDPRFM